MAGRAVAKLNLLLLAVLVACFGPPPSLAQAPLVRDPPNLAFPELDSRKADPRFCGPPPRYPSGEIIRSHKAKADYARIHPCPASGLPIPDGCTGWEINHVLPMASGGCDSIINMDWMRVEIKRCKDWWCRDRYERRIYGRPLELVPAPPVLSLP